MDPRTSSALDYKLITSFSVKDCDKVMPASCSERDRGFLPDLKACGDAQIEWLPGSVCSETNSSLPCYRADRIALLISNPASLPLEGQPQRGLAV